MSNRLLAWSQVDVFAEARFQGNQLAIFHDATGLSTEQMQTLARETNLSETTFILPRDSHDELENGVDVRIFTTEEELPFAGHPTLGTASWLYWHHDALRGAETISLRLKAGIVPVRFTAAVGNESSVYGEMTQRDPKFVADVEQRALAEALEIPPEHLHGSAHPQVVSTGMPFCIVPFASVPALSAMHLRQDLAKKYAASIGAKFFYCIAPTADPLAWRARMQFYNGEDPATGSACGCAIAYLVVKELVPSAVPVTVLQGMEINRPSRLTVRATRASGDKIVDVRVGGRTTLAASGQFFRP